MKLNGSFCSQIDALSDNPSVKEFKKYVRTVFSCPHYCENTSGTPVIRKIIDSLCYCDISLQARRMQYFKLLIKRVNSKTLLKMIILTVTGRQAFMPLCPLMKQILSITPTSKWLFSFTIYLKTPVLLCMISSYNNKLAASAGSATPT